MLGEQQSSLVGGGFQYVQGSLGEPHARGGPDPLSRTALELLRPAGITNAPLQIDLSAIHFDFLLPEIYEETLM